MHKRQSIQQEREQRAQNGEAKDPDWAYAMELKVREYASRNFRADQIQLVEIDCKTSFCDLKVEAFGPEANDRFSEVLSALPQEPWNDFVITTVSRNETDRVILGARLVRKTSDVETAEQLADRQLEADCAAMLGKQAQRTQAAREAEPRDPSWAGPMEQLLREHLATQLAMHSISRLDVTCRTSWCRVGAGGPTKQALWAFEKAVRAIGEEPWSDVRQGDGKGVRLGDAWDQEYLLFRESQ